MLLTLEFTFDSAHRLHLLKEHKCRHLHGHTYRLIVGVEGQVNGQFGWVEDFAVLKKRIKQVIQEYDHAVLVASTDNELLRICRENGFRYKVIEGIQTTAEVIISNLKKDLTDNGVRVKRLVLYETPVNCVELEE